MATQRQLTRQLTFQSLLLDSVRESVVALDNEYHVTFWNKGAESLFGYTAQEALRNAVGNLILPDAEAARAEWVAHMDALRRTGTWKGSTLRRRKDGTLFWTDVSASMVTDADGQPSGFVALHRDITELQRHQDELRDSHQRLRNLAASLIEVRELERTSLARELHDELGQVLTRLKIDLQWLCGRLPKYLRTLRTRQRMRLVDRIIDTTRHISSQLRPAILDDLGLEAALEWQTQEFVKWGRCRCKLDLCLEELRSNRERDTTVFRIVQEALTNVARHSQATAVHVGGRIAEGTLEVELHDNGIGLPERKLASKDSLGLIGMRERAEGIGGTVQFSRSPAGGTLVKIRVPLESQLRERTS